MSNTPVKVSGLPVANTYNANTKFLVASVVGGKTLLQSANGSILVASNTNPGLMSAADRVAIQQIVAANVASMATVAYVDTGLATKANTADLPYAKVILQADATLYVRSDGNDLNDGLTNNANGAFATIQACWQHVCHTYDLNSHQLKIKLGTIGQWLGFSTFGNTDLPENSLYDKSFTPSGGGVILIEGNTSAPTDYNMVTSSNGIADYSLIEMAHNFDTSVILSGVSHSGRSWISGGGVLQLIDCHVTLSNGWMNVSSASTVGLFNSLTANGSIAGSGIMINENGYMIWRATTTFDNLGGSGTFVNVRNGTLVYSPFGTTVIGTPFAGKQYNAEGNGFIKGAASLPGTTTGTLSTGGQVG